MRLFIFLITFSTIFANLKSNNQIFAVGSGDISKAGTIFHAFGWPLRDITANLQEIHAANFNSILISPVQREKQIAEITERKLSGWWALYQPLNFEIGNSLGTEDNLRILCECAHELDIKIIVDVVLNHVANDGGGDELTAEMFESQEKYDALFALHINKHVDPLLLRPEFFHTILADAVEATDRFTQTHGQLGGLPDLNTENQDLQQIIINFLLSLIGCGVDGLRFDAAQHIELPEESDGTGGSDFWPNVTQAITDKSRDIILIGEFLGDINVHYLKYMNLTYSRIGEQVRSAIYNKIAKFAIFPPDYDKSQLLCWSESHDDYTDGTSSFMLPEDLILGWALIAARSGAACLFLARNTLGILCGLFGGPIQGELPLWRNPAIIAVNRFHEAMGESPDYERIMYDCVFIVERGPQNNAEGAVIINLGDQDVILADKIGLKDGKYIDQIKGYKFTVKNNHLIGDPRLITFKGRSVSVLISKYNTELKSTCSREGGRFTDKIQVKLCHFGSQMHTYSINGEEPIPFASGQVVEFGGNDVPIGGEIALQVRCDTLSKTYIFKKVINTPRKVTFKGQYNWGTRINEDGETVPDPDWFGPYIYIYDKAGACTKENAPWDDAPLMIWNPETGCFEYYVPGDFPSDVRIIFKYKGSQLPCKKEEGFLLRCGENGTFEDGTWTPKPAPEP
ncbi:MAG: hypothetical protein LBJ95_03605 [Oscillospiraceae bacterium]|nr:hypothetical protein [Oscillospiraceae bacterium]